MPRMQSLATCSYLKKIKLKIQHPSATSHISYAQQPHVASGYYMEPHGYAELFPHAESSVGWCSDDGRSGRERMHCDSQFRAYSTLQDTMVVVPRQQISAEDNNQKFYSHTSPTIKYCGKQPCIQQQRRKLSLLFLHITSSMSEPTGTSDITVQLYESIIYGSYNF